MRLNFITAPPIPDILPEDLAATVKELSQYETRQEVLQAAYELLTTKYRGYRIKTLTRLIDLFEDDPAKLWAKNGFLHCTNMNYLLKIMLLRSHKFNEADIKFAWTAIHFYSPHEYVQVRLDENIWVDVDIWAKAYGIPFGEHAHGLHSGSVREVW